MCGVNLPQTGVRYCRTLNPGEEFCPSCAARVAVQLVERRQPLLQPVTPVQLEALTALRVPQAEIEALDRNGADMIITRAILLLAEDHERRREFRQTVREVGAGC